MPTLAPSDRRCASSTDRSFERGEQLGGSQRSGDRVGAWQQHGKLVAAQASYRVRVAHTGSEARAHLLQQSVAGLVAERVVDFLEAVQIE